MVHCRIDPKLAISTVAVCVHRCSPPSCYNDGKIREERRSEYGEECAGEKGLGKSGHRRLNGAGICVILLCCPDVSLSSSPSLLMESSQVEFWNILFC